MGNFMRNGEVKVVARYHVTLSAERGVEIEKLAVVLNGWVEIPTRVAAQIIQSNCCSCRNSIRINIAQSNLGFA